MQLTEISFWGMVPLLLLFLAAVALFWVVDRRLLYSVVHTLCSAAKNLFSSHVEWRVAVAVTGGAAVAVVVTSGVLMVCLPLRWLLPVAALMALAVCETIGASVTAYMRSFNNTQAHRYYMLANGATQLESLVPSLRRALRACIVPQARRRGLPMMLKAALLFIGLLMGGVAAATAALTTLLLWAASFVTLVIATLMTAFLLKKLNICS